MREQRLPYLVEADGLSADLGTFADSKRAPIHRWFEYPAGFSWKAVCYVLRRHGIGPGQVVYDPFVGTGTTVVECQKAGVSSVGVEAHPFVCWVAATKCRRDYDARALAEVAEDIFSAVRSRLSRGGKPRGGAVPALVRKCFSEENLRVLLTVREVIEGGVAAWARDFFKLALTCTLRRASRAATGWPYIAPKKEIQERPALECFERQVREMLADLDSVASASREVQATIVLGDARHAPLADATFDLAFTSPPYLNNYDYADRTRLESYFNGVAATWGEISEQVRAHLIMAATTQVIRSAYDPGRIVSAQVKDAAPRVAREIQAKVNQLGQRRKGRGGKKSYDIMVGQYFNDMAAATAETWRVLKPGAALVMILGDSAPYGVHIPTEQYLAQIGMGLGFRRYEIETLRARGGKWAGNPQRHHVPLRESMVTLYK